MTPEQVVSEICDEYGRKSREPRSMKDIMFAEFWHHRLIDLALEIDGLSAEDAIRHLDFAQIALAMQAGEDETLAGASSAYLSEQILTHMAEVINAIREKCTDA